MPTLTDKCVENGPVMIDRMREQMKPSRVRKSREIEILSALKAL